ncbi:MAG: hypothetical protein MHMPM18_001534 [Marteilia pararefringens]
MRFNSSTGQVADGKTVFRHTHEDKKFSNESKYRSVLFLDQVQQIVNDATRGDLYVEREDKNEFLKSEIIDTSQMNDNDDKLLKILLKTSLIPRKPKWDPSIDSVTYEKIVLQSFRAWRAQLEESGNETSSRLTYFEYNLNVWKQFWLVIERSDVVAQIVDARNPFAYICPDIVEICKENNKSHILVINKSDMLSDEQQILWKDYFMKKEINFIFWNNRNSGNFNNFKDLVQHSLECDYSSGFKVGFVGYQNVGKSSTINSLAGKNAVAASATPGKTKILQTIKIDESNILFDCPGLFIPKFFRDSADIALLGLYPPDAINEILQVVQRIIERIPAYDLCKFLKLNFFELTNYDVYNVLELFGLKNRIMIGSQRVDNTKAAKLILKRYMEGSILYCHPTPDYAGTASEFNKYTSKSVKDERRVDRILEHMAKSNINSHRNRSRKVNFFKEMKKVKRSTI